MKKIIALICLVIFYFLVAQIASASGFTSAYVRLNNESANSSLSGTVCAQPSSATSDTENKVVIDFPDDFTISSSASNWITSTTNLPENSTAWPGIGSTATSVSGNTVTFSGNDLTLDTLYCFNFSSSASSTGSTGSDKTGTITTKNSSNATIDETTYALAIVSSSQINITARVGSDPNDLQVNINLEGNSPISQGSEQTFKITYGTILTYSTPLTLTAFWGQGTIEGDSAPFLDIVDYVVGSATNGINSTAPVIDLVNNKITWNFSSFPANSANNTVTFKLKTNSSYKGSKKVNFEVRGQVSDGGATKNKSINPYYLYTTSTTVTPTPTPQAQELEEAFEFGNIEARTITENSASIFVQTPTHSKILLSYGVSSSLTNSVSSSNFQTAHLLNLKNLKPNTVYYFKILATDKNGKQISSDIFTFKTALSPTSTSVNLNSIVVVSGNNAIFDTLGKNATSSAQNIIIIPQRSNFQFKFAIEQAKKVKDIKLLFRKVTGKTVLGANTLMFQANAASISVVEIENGVYSIALRSDIEPGIYQLFARYLDEVGNLNEQELSFLKITNPFTVLNKNKEPVEGARVFIYAYNQQEKRYIPLSSSSLNIENPLFTNSEGQLTLVLPKGKYKAIISEIGFKDKTQEFEISQKEKSGYPIVILEKIPITIFTLIRYYWRNFNEVFLAATFNYFGSLQNSIRFFDLVSAFTMLALVGLTFYAFLRKNNIQHFPSYLVYLLHHFSKKGDEKYIKGVVRDKSGSSISGVHIYLIDDPNQEVINTTTTNVNGEFFFKKGNSRYYLIAMKKGYFSASQIEAKTNGFNIYEMEKKDSGEKALLDYLQNIAGGIFALSFESLLIFTLVFLLIFLDQFGLEKTAPFILLSVFNILVWAMHLRHARHHPTRIS